jgi:hypothetical protein
MTYSFEAKLGCIERELKYRRRVYPRWIEEKRMSTDFAREQIRIMEEIAEDYRQKEQEERLL